MALSEIMKILAVALTLAASLTPVGPLGELTDLAVKRVQVADLVAAAKFGTPQPIDDPAREQQVLDTVRTKAAQLSLDPENAARFFRAQIEANKLVQRGLYARWTEHPEEVPSRRPDLGTEVRPILDRLTTDILNELKDTEQLRKPTLRCEIHATFAERSAVVLHHLDPLHENALAEAMRPVCSK
ncbi:chorismate mutase [Lentzea atacamensis]|uniref:chorismate mutase n=1 Tax=Lentzea atacamensis TaxID=531938 RepID=A0ABX9E8N1_9PSEU|nr:chorismate mutase [Lentzea atacamensis]RAS66064.1 chorismate mutase [Lentzea atacamensis]